MQHFLDDARRFILKFRYIAGTAPLQLYISGLVFAPAGSMIKQLFLEEKPSWISIPRHIEDNWGAQLQTFEGHKDELRSIAFSSNGLLLASCGEDETVKIWEFATGTLRHTFSGYNNTVVCVAFSLDSQVLVSIAKNGTIKLWDVATGILQRNMMLIDGYIYDAAFSLDICLLATLTHCTIAIWDLWELRGTCMS